jgi:hypothetical protein
MSSAVSSPVVFAVGLRVRECAVFEASTAPNRPVIEEAEMSMAFGMTQGTWEVDGRLGDEVEIVGEWSMASTVLAAGVSQIERKARV